MRKIEILIVVALLLLLAALACGCKDEAEANEGATKLVNGIECKKYGSGWTPIKSFCPKCGEFSPWSNNCSKCGTENYKENYQYVCPNDHSTYSADPYCRKCGGKTTLKDTNPEPEFLSIDTTINDPNLIWIWEPDYPIDITFAGGTIGEYVNFKVGEDNEIVCDSTREKWLRYMYQSMSSKEPTGEVTLRFEEPNEPEVITIDPNSELVRSLNLLYDPNFYKPNEYD